MLSRLSGLCLALTLLAPAALLADQPDYAQDVAISSDPSPVDAVTGSSVDQFGRHQTNSQVDNYLYQNEQINLDKDSGIVKVLRTNQKANINDFVTEIIPLKHANPRELRGLARTICRKEGGDADVVQDKVTKQNYLAVVCPPFQLPYLRDTLTAVDQPWVAETNSGIWFAYYKGQYRNVHNMMDILQLYRSPDGYWDFDDPNNAVMFSDQPNVEKLWEWGTQSVDVPPSELQLDVTMYEVDKQNDLNLGFDFASWKNGPGRNLFDAVLWDFDGEKGPQLFPGNAPANTSNFGRFLSYNFTVTTAYLDFLQAKGKARVVNKSQIATKSGTVGEVSALDQIASFSGSSTPVPDDVTSAAPLRLGDLYNFYAKQHLTDFTLEELVEQPASTEIASIDNLLSNVLDVSYSDRASIDEALETAGADGHISTHELNEILLPSTITLHLFHNRTLDYLKSGQTGVLLSVLPEVGLESAEMSVALDVSDVDGYTPSGAPIIEHRYVASDVEVKDGQPMALGGVTRSAMISTGDGIPFLRDLPVAGYLFGRETTVKRDKDMVVLMIPRFKLCPAAETKPPKELVEAQKLAQGKDVLQVPSNAFGFDQWLLDRLQRNQ